MAKTITWASMHVAMSWLWVWSQSRLLRTIPSTICRAGISACATAMLRSSVTCLATHSPCTPLWVTSMNWTKNEFSNWWRPRHTMRQIAVTGRGDKSPRLHCCCDKSLALSLSLRYVARIQTSLNLCDRSQRRNSVAATVIFTCHTRRFVASTCRGDVAQRFVASCVSALKGCSRWKQLSVTHMILSMMQENETLDSNNVHLPDYHEWQLKLTG